MKEKGEDKNVKKADVRDLWKEVDFLQGQTYLISNFAVIFAPLFIILFLRLFKIYQI